MYKKCFEVDIFHDCDKGPLPPIVPKVESRVKLLELDNVTLDDIYKFTFE